MSNIEHLHRSARSIMRSWRPKNSPRNRYCRCIVIPAEQRSERLVNCAQVPCAPSHTGIENSPQPRPWKQRKQNISGV